jgi:hypothetical protein
VTLGVACLIFRASGGRVRPGLHSLTAIGEKDGMFAVEQVVKIADGARTMGLDRETQTISSEGLLTSDSESFRQRRDK